MTAGHNTQQFVLLPARGLRATLPAASAAVQSFLLSAETARASARPMTLGDDGGPEVDIRVLDSIHEDGAKLVELSPSAALALRAAQPGLRLVPIVYFRPAVAPRATARSGPKTVAGQVATK